MERVTAETLEALKKLMQGYVDENVAKMEAAYERVVEKGKFLALNEIDTMAEWNAYATAAGLVLQFAKAEDADEIIETQIRFAVRTTKEQRPGTPALEVYQEALELLKAAR